MALISQIRQIGDEHPGADQVPARGPRRLRGGPVLRRQHDHSGDLGALGRRGDEDDLVLDGRLVDPDHGDDHRRALRAAEARQRRGRAVCSVRSCWSGSPRSPCSGSAGSRCTPRCSRRSRPSYAFDFLFHSGSTGFFALDVGRARVHRGGGSLRGHGPLRATGDHARLAAAGLPRLHPQLPRPGSADPGRPERHQRAVLPADAARRTDSTGDPGNSRDCDRLPGGDLRRLLDRPPGVAAGLPPAPARHPHLRPPVRAGLRADHQPAPARRGSGAGTGLPVLGQARLRLRDRGDRDDPGDHGAVLLHRATPLALACSC